MWRHCGLPSRWTAFVVARRSPRCRALVPPKVGCAFAIRGSSAGVGGDGDASFLALLVRPLDLEHFMTTFFDGSWLLCPHSSAAASSPPARGRGRPLSPATEAGTAAAYVSSRFALGDVASLLGGRNLLWRLGDGAAEAAGSLDEAQQAFSDGRSLALLDVHRALPCAAQLGGALARALGVPVRLDGHLAPPGSASQAPAVSHAWGTFVLQTSGQRTWQLAGAPRPVTLRTGDVLYVPSGLACRAEALPEGGELSLHVAARVEGQHFTWAALASLVGARIHAVGSPPPVATIAALEEVLLANAPRVPTLAGSRMRSVSAGEDASDGAEGIGVACSLPAVLQYSALVPEDLPPGWLDDLARQLKRVLRQLSIVGHLDHPAQARAPPAADELLPNARTLVEAALSADEATLRAALAWALAQLRRRGARAEVLHGVRDGEAFASLARAFRGGDRGLADASLRRPRGRRPFLFAAEAEEPHLLYCGAVEVIVPHELTEAAAWCLGRWSGAGGRPFRLAAVPGGRHEARRAVELLIRAGALEAR